MKKTILILTAAFLAGCADGGGSTSNNAGSLSCEIPSRENLSEQSAETQNVNLQNEIPNISVDDSKDISAYKNFIVKFKGESTGGLQPSGNPVREFIVKGVTFKYLVKNTHTVELNMSADERRQFVANLRADKSVDYIEPDYPVHTIESTNEDQSAVATDADDISATTNDTYFSKQWMHRNVQTEKAWLVTTGSKEIVVAVLDSGIDYTHADLKNNMWINPQEMVNGKDDDNNGYVDDVYGWNFVSNNAFPKTTSRSNHGSHVAGIIGATGSNNTGIVGMAPDVRMMALRFIGDTGTGSTSGAIRGIDYAVQKRVFAINNSWGSGGTSRALGEAILRAEKAGVLFLVAAGNGTDGVGFSIDKKPWYPAAYNNSNVLAVAATKPDDYLTAFSNFGLTKVDVAAPGAQILSTVSNQAYQNMSGTSMATPLVTGLAVLVKAANPNLTYREVIQIIRGSVDRKASLTNKVASGGRVNAYRAVTVAAQNINKSPDAQLELPCP